MAQADYKFLTRWRVRGTVDEVWDILSDAVSLPRWWPAVYLDVRETRCGGAHNGGVGTEFELLTRGWLPYTLRWGFRVTEVSRPERMALDAFGDFIGRGVWSFRQNAEFVDIEYDWRVRADKPLLKYGSPILKPFFSMNHRWAMQTGQESLQIEVDRRRKEIGGLRQPPQSSNSSAILVVAATVVLAFVASHTILRRK